MTETSRATCRTSGLSLVLCPRLPPIEAALTHLHRIDATRIYCNKGPLWHEFCDGMALRLAPVLSRRMCAWCTPAVARPQSRRRCARALVIAEE